VSKYKPVQAVAAESLRLRHLDVWPLLLIETVMLQDQVDIVDDIWK